jgi:glutathione S-transferase
MSEMILHVGNKNYSSWSLRPSLALAHTGAAFRTALIQLDQPDSKARMLAVNPAGRVPVLVDGDLTIWDSLAICEYLADKFPAAHLWPNDARVRARARAVSAEMHSGFAAVRTLMPMDLRSRKPTPALTEAAHGEIARIHALWRTELAAHGGPFLFGAFTIADAMFAPVTTRFTTYGIPLDATCQAYVDAIAALPGFRTWYADAVAEPWTL